MSSASASSSGQHSAGVPSGATSPTTPLACFSSGLNAAGEPSGATSLTTPLAIATGVEDEPASKKSKFSPDLQIFVNTPLGKTITLHVRGDDKVGYIKAKTFFLAKDKYPVTQQRLVFEGEELSDGKVLSDYGIEKGAVLRLLSGMQVFVKTLTGKTLLIDVDGGDFVEDVRRAAMDASRGSDRADILQQRLVFEGKTLMDLSPLSSNGIYPGMTLHLAPRFGAHEAVRPR